jgi:hypothetical protein
LRITTSHKTVYFSSYIKGPNQKKFIEKKGHKITVMFLTGKWWLPTPHYFTDLKKKQEALYGLHLVGKLILYPSGKF